MRTRIPFRALAVLALLTAMSRLLAQDPEPVPTKLSKEELAKATKAVKDHLAKVKGSHAQVKPLSEGPVAQALPGLACFSVMFRRYPVASAVPEGLKPSSVFACGRDGKVVVLDNADALAKLANQYLVPATTDDAIKNAARAALQLNEQLLQDGFYTFTIQDDAIKVTTEKEGRVIEAKSVVMKGGNGELIIRLTFTPTGKLRGWETRGKVTPGPRPRCQATKLLDNDPIVRAMAEDALLGMGRAAREYLDEQRARAAPELKKAIDRIWQRILERDR